MGWERPAPAPRPWVSRSGKHPVRMPRPRLDLWRAEPSAVPLMQPVRTPARQAAGPVRQTRPILSTSSVSGGAVGADDLRHLFSRAWPMPPETTGKHPDGREGLHGAAPGPTRPKQRVRPCPPSWGGGCWADPVSGIGQNHRAVGVGLGAPGLRRPHAETSSDTQVVQRAGRFGARGPHRGSLVSPCARGNSPIRAREHWLSTCLNKRQGSFSP